MPPPRRNLPPQTFRTWTPRTKRNAEPEVDIPAESSGPVPQGMRETPILASHEDAMVVDQGRWAEAGSDVPAPPVAEFARPRPPGQRRAGTCEASVDAAVACEKLLISNTTEPCRAAIARVLTATLNNSGKDASERVLWLEKQGSSINNFVTHKMSTGVLAPKIPTGQEAKAIMRHRDSPDIEAPQWKRVHCADCKAQIVNNKVACPKIIADLSQLHCCMVCRATGGICHQIGCRQACHSSKTCGGPHGPIYSHMIHMNIIKAGSMDEITAHDSRSTLLAKQVMEGCTMTTTTYRMCQAAFAPKSKCDKECTALRLKEGDDKIGEFGPCPGRCAYGEGHMFPCLCNSTLPTQAHRELPRTNDGQNACSHCCEAPMCGGECRSPPGHEGSHSCAPWDTEHMANQVQKWDARDIAVMAVIRPILENSLAIYQTW